MKIIQFISDNRYKIMKTLLTYGTYFCLGCTITLVGSSLLDLQIRLNTDFATVSYAIPIRSAGHIIGSAIAGAIGQRFSDLIVLTFANLVAGVSLAIAPFFTQFTYFAIFLLIVGLNSGIIDIACNSLITSTWKEKSANFLQVLHMSFGIGALIAPVICRLFLLPNTEEDTGLIQTQSNLTPNRSSTDPVVGKIEYTSQDVMVQYAYLIIAICTVVCSIPFGCFYIKEKSATITLTSTKAINSEDTKQNYSLIKAYTAVALTACISHLVFATETLIGSLGPSFSVKSGLHMEKKTGVLLTTVFWSCFSFYRLIFIPMTFIVSETKLLLSAITFTLIGLLITVPWANSYTQCIWAGFTLIGIGISPLFSAAYGMIAKHINVTNRISSIIFIPGVLGESIHPAIAAKFITTNPVICLYYLGVLGALLIVFYLTLITYCAKVFKAPIDPRHREVSIQSSIRSISRY